MYISYIFVFSKEIVALNQNDSTGALLERRKKFLIIVNIYTQKFAFLYSRIFLI